MCEDSKVNPEEEQVDDNGDDDKTRSAGKEMSPDVVLQDHVLEGSRC